MVSVDSVVTCPLCDGEATEDFDCRSEYASYFCYSCGYTSNSDAIEKPKTTLRRLPKVIKPFVKRGNFDDDSGAVYRGEMLWWPGGMVLAGEYSITPVIIKAKLMWRRADIEEIPEEEQKNYPIPESNQFYKCRESESFADYESFQDAREASREDNLARSMLQKNPPKILLLCTDKKQTPSTQHRNEK